MKIGLLGGSFNPPHNGHRHLAQCAFAALELDKIYVVPTYITPGKKSSLEVSPEDRLAMTRLAFEDLPFCQVLPLEIQRQEISYTIDTVKALKTPGDQLIILISQDRMLDLAGWKDIDLILQEASFAVMARSKEPKGFTSSAIPVTWIQAPYLEISSTLIRDKLQRRQNCREWLPAKVLDYIKSHELY